MQVEDESAGRALGVRWPEIAVALLLLAVAAVVIADSLRVGIGWADDGPRSGHFPFWVGVLLAASSAWTLVSQLRRWRQPDPFATREQLRRVGQVLVPMLVYVAAMRWLGLYLTSALLIGWFMARHGKHRPLTTALIALGVPLLAFFVFERWFLVPLPKGPVEAWLGL
jgi:putative tricarboxylic transport membrane protein